MRKDRISAIVSWNSCSCAWIIVDAAGELLNRVLKHRPFLIKPNHHELGDLFGVRIDALQDAFPYARQLQAMGAQNVLVSMGASGALLIGEDGREYVCAAVQGEPINTVGAGDSMVAGFLSGYIESDGNLLHALKKGVAAGSAARFQKRWQKLPKCLPCSLN